MSVYRPAHEDWHDYLPGECQCDEAYRDRKIVDDRCPWHRLLFAVEDLRDNGWQADPPIDEPDYDPTVRFNAGVDPQGVVAYEPSEDDARLRGQLLRIVELMIDGEYRTLPEICDATGDPHSSVSAQLRHLRKPRFGKHIVEKRPRGERGRGYWEYRLLWNGDKPVFETVVENY